MSGDAKCRLCGLTKAQHDDQTQFQEATEMPNAVIARIDIQWVRSFIGTGYDMQIEKRYGDGTIVRLHLNEDEVALITQLNGTERKEVIHA
jgi:hypothetical protein